MSVNDHEVNREKGTYTSAGKRLQVVALHYVFEEYLPIGNL